MFIIYYVIIAAVLLAIAVAYQGYCDAKCVRNKFAEWMDEDKVVVMAAAILRPVTLFILLMCLFVLVLIFPFWLIYNFSKNYFSKEKENK